MKIQPLARNSCSIELPNNIRIGLSVDGYDSSLWIAPERNDDKAKVIIQVYNLKTQQWDTILNDNALVKISVGDNV